MDGQRPSKSPLRAKAGKTGNSTAIDTSNPVAALKNSNPKLFNNYLLESKDLDNMDTFVEDDDTPVKREAINPADGLYQSSPSSSSRHSDSPRIFDTGLSLNQMT